MHDDGARKFDHVTPLLRELHWLSVPEPITFKLATLVFRCLHGTTPAYLAKSFNRAADYESRRRLYSGASSALWFRRLAAVLLVTALSRSQARASGTVCQPRWHH